jgi:hypothetical protein
LALQHNIKWIGGNIPPSTGEKTEWECPKHHRWFASYGSIKRGTGCPRCKKTFPKTMEDYHRVASIGGWKWLGSELPGNNKSMTLWECPNGHQIMRSYNHMDKGYGCRECAKQETAQRVKVIRSKISKTP